MASLAYFKRTLPAPTATVDGFVCVLNEDWFLQANPDALDGTTFSNGGGNLIVYEDAALTSRLSVDVVSFVTGASPIAEVWIRLPTYSAAKDVYISADDTQTTQPLPSSAFGQYDVWQDYDFVAHFNEVSGGAENSTGNSNVATVTSSNITRNVTGKVGSCYRFNGSQSAITPDIKTVDYWNESFSEATIGIWAYVENDSSGPYVLFEEGGLTNGHAIFYRTGPHTWHYSCTDSSAETELSSSTVTLPNSGWVFVVGVYEGGNCKLYINGTQEDTGFRGSSIGTHNDSTGIGDLSGSGWAGNTGTGNGVPFNGLLDTPFRSSIPFDSSRISATFDNQSDISSFGTSSDWTIPSVGDLITPTGIAGGSLVGEPSLLLSSVLIQPQGVESSALLGQPVLTQGGVSIRPEGIINISSIGLANVLPGGVSISPIGVESITSLGEPSLLTVLSPQSIGSGEVVGEPSIIYSQLVSIESGIGSGVKFGIALILDGESIVIPVNKRGTYQKIAEYLRDTDRFVSYQNNDIIVEWLKMEGIPQRQFNDLFYAYWEREGYSGAYNDKWKKWRNDGTVVLVSGGDSFLDEIAFIDEEDFISED